MSLGVVLAVAAFFLELGLAVNVAMYPYFVLSFVAILVATVVGGALGGLVAAGLSWSLNTFVLAERVPAEAIRPILDGINSALAFGIGMYLRDLRRRPMQTPPDELAAARRRPSGAERRAAREDPRLGDRRSRQLSFDRPGRRRPGTTAARGDARGVGRGVRAVPPRPAAGAPGDGRCRTARPAGPPRRVRRPGGHRRERERRPGNRGDADDPDRRRAGGRRRGPARGRCRGSRRRQPRSASTATTPTANGRRPAVALDSAVGATAVALARLAGSALERDRLVARGRAATDAASDATGRVSSFSRLAAQLGGALTVDAVGRLLVEHAVTELGAEFGLAYAVDRRERSFTLVHARGYPVGLVQREATLAAEVDGPVVRAAATGRPVEIGSPEEWRREFPAQSDLPAMTGMRSLVAWPLGDVGRRGGVLVIGWAVAGAIDSRTREVLAATADQGGQAFERAGLHAQEREAQQLQEAFISVISHELRTPITTILAGSRLLRRQIGDGSATPEVAADLAADIEAESDRLFRIVEDLLVLSRLERRNLSIAQEPVHVAHLVERVVASEARRWPTHHFVTPNRPEVRVVRGEETYIEQVLRNLLANAAKYSPTGSTVEVMLEDDADGVAVRVLDDGPGIARAEVEQLFSLFYRSPATAATAAGAGIGLFVSRQLVDAMGGRMWAQRRRRGGSEFGFSLAGYPFDEDEPMEVRTMARRRVPVDNGATPGRTPR